jgi:pimeloyl-ACP methyl ester carboxylesterase
MADDLPLILLPGMGADRRLFQAQIAAFENLITPDWIPLEPGDTLVAYARRMARAVDPGGPCLVGGSSFGGMVAVEMSRYLPAKACFLIGSIRSPDEFPRRLRALKPLISLIPRQCGGLPRALGRVVLALGGRLMRPTTRLLFQQVADSDGRFIRWAALAVFGWVPPAEPPRAPVFQIHGDRDRVLPHRWTRPDVLVRGAGHTLSMTFPQAVNDFLRSHMERLSAD